MSTDQHEPRVTKPLASAVFRSEPKWVAAARSWATVVYGTADGGDPDGCALLVSELAANVVTHTDSAEFEVRLFRDRTIEVWDGSDQPLQPRLANAESTGGRGLMLLTLMAPGYTVEPEAGGKTVRFRLEDER